MNKCFLQPHWYRPIFHQAEKPSHLVAEKSKQDFDRRHPLYRVLPVERRLKSRFSFVNKKCQIPDDTLKIQEAILETMVKTPMPSHWSSRNTFSWRNSSMAHRCLKGRLKALLKKWGATDGYKCKCGETQTMQHIVQRSDLCLKYLVMATPEATSLALTWQLCL